jgi:hypothetical protein
MIDRVKAVLKAKGVVIDYRNDRFTLDSRTKLDWSHLSIVLQSFRSIHSMLSSLIENRVLGE